MASYAAIVEAIDAAILDWIGEPISIQTGQRQLTFRSLDELTRARRYYAQLAASASAGGRKFRISEIKANGAR